MADKDNQQPLQGDALATEQARQKALADAQAEAEKKRLDEGEEGGHYIVNGVHVNANGDPLKDANKKSKDESK